MLNLTHILGPTEDVKSLYYIIVKYPFIIR